MYEERNEHEHEHEVASNFHLQIDTGSYSIHLDGGDIRFATFHDRLCSRAYLLYTSSKAKEVYHYYL